MHMAIVEHNENPTTHPVETTGEPEQSSLPQQPSDGSPPINITNSTIGTVVVGPGGKGEGAVHITTGSSAPPPSASGESAPAAGFVKRIWARVKEWWGLLSLPIFWGFALVPPWPSARLCLLGIGLGLSMFWVFSVARTSRLSTAAPPARGARLRRGVVRFLTVLVLVTFLPSMRARALSLPAGVERNDALRAAVSSAAEKAGYDRGPVNVVTVQVVDVGILRGSREIYLLTDFPWTKQDGVLVRNYRGRGLYRGTYVEQDGKVRIETLDLLDYAVAPTSPTLAYVLGSLEVDVAMGKPHVVQDPLLRALQELPSDKLAVLSR